MQIGIIGLGRMGANIARRLMRGGHAPVVYDKQQEIRQLLIDEVRARGTLDPADYFQHNWELRPTAAFAPLLGIP